YSYIRGPGADADRLLDEGSQIGLYNNHLTVRGIKIVQDGALGSRGAALLKPYSDADTRGFLIHKDDEIYPTIKKATERGIQMVIHAIGDRGNRNVLDLYARAFSEVPKDKRKLAAPRFRIEHAQVVALDDIPRFAQLGVIPSMQPSHAIGDLHFAVRRLGMDRMTEGYAWRTFIDLGCYIPAGSDAPVEEGNPLIEFYAACVRKDTTGFSAEGWHPELRMTREEALKSLTIWGAKAAFEEDIKGSLEPGKLADLVVLDRDLMTEPEERLFNIKVLMAVIGGEIVYEREGTFTSKIK
ncbi:MAG: amidohydrolase, partial [bacterium]